jgi:hypothetical protein
VGELHRGSQAAVLSPGQATSTLAALQRLQRHYEVTGRRVSILSGIEQYCDAAEALYARTSSASLGEAVAGYLSGAATVKRKDVAQAVEDFLAGEEPRTKSSDGQRPQVSPKYHYNRAIMLRRFAGTFPKTALCDLTKPHLDSFVNGLAGWKSKVSKRKTGNVGQRPESPYGAHFSKGNQSGKEAIDRIGGSGVFGRDADSLIILTPLKAEGAYSVELILRNLPEHPSFAIQWQFPLMLDAPELDPNDLKPARGRKKQYESLELLAAIEETTTSGPISITRWQSWLVCHAKVYASICPECAPKGGSRLLVRVPKPGNTSLKKAAWLSKMKTKIQSNATAENSKKQLPAARGDCCCRIINIFGSQPTTRITCRKYGHHDPA